MTGVSLVCPSFSLSNRYECLQARLSTCLLLLLLLLSISLCKTTSRRKHLIESSTYIPCWIRADKPSYMSNLPETIYITERRAVAAASREGRGVKTRRWISPWLSQLSSLVRAEASCGGIVLVAGAISVVHYRVSFKRMRFRHEEGAGELRGS